jgi:hypothetical protein
MGAWLGRRLARGQHEPATGGSERNHREPRAPITELAKQLAHPDFGREKITISPLINPTFFQ